MISGRPWRRFNSSGPSVLTCCIRERNACTAWRGNHLLHNIRRNLDITLIVHDNRVYGLTKGQASPTSELGFKTKVQTFGVISEPLRPLALALALGCGFVAQAFSGYRDHAAEVIARAIRHRGFSLVNMLHSLIEYFTTGPDKSGPTKTRL